MVQQSRGGSERLLLAGTSLRPVEQACRGGRTPWRAPSGDALLRARRSVASQLIQLWLHFITHRISSPLPLDIPFSHTAEVGRLRSDAALPLSLLRSPYNASSSSSPLSVPSDKSRTVDLNRSHVPQCSRFPSHLSPRPRSSRGSCFEQRISLH